MISIMVILYTNCATTASEEPLLVAAFPGGKSDLCVFTNPCHNLSHAPHAPRLLLQSGFQDLGSSEFRISECPVVGRRVPFLFPA